MWVVKFTPWRLYLWGKAPNEERIGGWVGSRAGLDVLEKRELLPLPEIKHTFLGRTARSLVTASTTLSRLLEETQ